MLKLHLDTDIGGDIDDLCALALVLNWPGAELVAITTVAEHQGKRAGYARYVLGLAGREDIPVAAGADASLDCYRSWQGLPDENAYWPGPVPPSPTSLDRAISLLENSIEQGAAIVAIGPFTNLALLEKRSPGILRRARLYLMGGFIFPPREGFPVMGSDMDWNVQVDAQSAQVVLQRSNPTLVPLSVTVETSLRRAYLPILRQSGPVAQLLARQAEAFARDENMEARYGQTCRGLPDDTINFQHDPLACAVALGWNEGVEIREIPLISEIQDGWLLQRMDGRGQPTSVVCRVDGEGFNKLWLDAMTRKNSTMVIETLSLQGNSERIDDVRQYIREHIDEPLNREVLAAVAGFSVPHFHRIFTAQVGENIAGYVRRVRLERAGRKLRMGAVDITEVALAAGLRYPRGLQ